MSWIDLWLRQRWGFRWSWRFGHPDRYNKDEDLCNECGVKRALHKSIAHMFKEQVE